jgi:hypothetical protein
MKSLGVGMAVAARAGTPKPDISTVDAFKRAFLDGKSIACPPQGAVGIHLAKVFERLGIAEQMKNKTRICSLRALPGLIFGHRAVVQIPLDLGSVAKRRWSLSLAAGLAEQDFWPELAGLVRSRRLGPRICDH